MAFCNTIFSEELEHLQHSYVAILEEVLCATTFCIAELILFQLVESEDP